jgi:hypothetical protein
VDATLKGLIKLREGANVEARCAARVAIAREEFRLTCLLGARLRDRAARLPQAKKFAASPRWLALLEGKSAKRPATSSPCSAAGECRQP